MKNTCKNNFANILQNGEAKAAFQRANLNFKFLDETLQVAHGVTEMRLIEK